MTTIIGIIAFVVIALVGWAISELKEKGCKYDVNAEEQQVLDQSCRQVEQNGFSEQNIDDVIRNISTKGFTA